MVCPYCHSATRVTNSRPQHRTNSVWRRRKCTHCDATISSIEKANFASTLLFKSKKSEVPFSEDTLFVSIYECCKHRLDAIESARYLTHNIIAKLQHNLKSPVIERDYLINKAVTALRHYDRAASVQYAAYHP